MKIGYAVTYHYSKNRPKNLDKIALDSISSFYDSCKYNFGTYIIDNQSEPKNSFTDLIDATTENMHYTYIEDQYEKGITGAWNLSIKQAIKDDCDLIVLAGEDIIFDDTLNNACCSCLCNISYINIRILGFVIVKAWVSIVRIMN